MIVGQLSEQVNDRSVSRPDLIYHNFDDGNDDMYDDGNMIKTDLAALVPYTNATISAGESFFVAGSTYFSKHNGGIWVMAAKDMSISQFGIYADLEADGEDTMGSRTQTIKTGGVDYLVIYS